MKKENLEESSDDFHSEGSILFLYEITNRNSNLEFKNFASPFFKVLPLITNTAIIINLKIANANLENLLEKGNHLESIKFKECALETHNIKIRSKINFKLKSLDFIGSKFHSF